MHASRADLIRWSIWFFFGNVVLFWLIGLGYISTISWLDMGYFNAHGKTVIKSFAALSYIGQLGLLAMLPGLLLLLFIWLFPKRNFIFGLAILIATCAAFFLVIDVNTYKVFRFHLNGPILDLAINGLDESVWEMSWVEYTLLSLIILGLLIGESLYAVCVWRYFIHKPAFKTSIKWIIIVLGLSLYTSYTMIIYSSGYIFNRVLVDVSRFLPFYTEIFGSLLPVKDGRILLDRLSESNLIQPKKANLPLNYPLSASQCEAPKRPKNFVMIVVDTWRFDQLNADVTPTLTEFAKKSWVFKSHFSGGNATGPGIFSLFYGLPVSYWTSMEVQQRGPVLLDEMVKQGYQMGIFGSATLKLPPFNKTVFRAVKNLRLTTPGATPYKRDIAITQELKQFITDAAKQPNKPFFGFAFYDSAHSYCAFTEDMDPRHPTIKNCNRMELTNETDPVPYLNRYKNALSLVDQQIKQVFDTLKKHNLLDNTVVMITGDHGEEFNDNHLNYWGHASNFTRYQTQTPLIIYWPKEKPKTFAYQTSHFDIAPTLMTKLFGCKNVPEQISLGRSLFDSTHRPYLIVGSYTGYGIIEPAQITNISPTGNFRLEQLDGKPSPSAKLNKPVMQSVFHDLRRFYKKVSV